MLCASMRGKNTKERRRSLKVCYLTELIIKRGKEMFPYHSFMGNARFGPQNQTPS